MANRVTSRPALIALAAAGGAVGLALQQRRHLQAMAADPDYRRLTAPIGGEDLGPVASADGTALHVVGFGSGSAPATLVLAHGWTERLDLWGPVIERLASEALRVVAYDLRGHGGSAEAVDGDYSLQRFGEDLEAVLAAVGSEPARTAVAGHSLGAMSIAAWADAFDVTDRVGAAALVNTGLSNLIGGGLILGQLGSRLVPESVGRAFLVGGRSAPVSTSLGDAIVRHVTVGPDASPGTVAYIERMIASTPQPARAATAIALSTLDLSAAVPRITVPTLVVAGEDDRLTPPAHARAIAADLPHLERLIVLPRTGHMSPLERPDELSDALRDLLDAAGVTGERPESAAAST